jgi:hypothetical protein
MAPLNEPVEVDLEPDVEKGKVMVDSCGPRGVFTKFVTETKRH